MSNKNKSEFRRKEALLKRLGGGTNRGGTNALLGERLL